MASGTAAPGRRASKRAASGRASPLRSSQRKFLCHVSSSVPKKRSTASVARKRRTICLRVSNSVTAVLLQVNSHTGTEIQGNRGQVFFGISIAVWVSIMNEKETSPVECLKVKAKPLFRSHAQVKRVVAMSYLALPVRTQSADRSANDLPFRCRGI